MTLYIWLNDYSSVLVIVHAATLVEARQMVVASEEYTEYDDEEIKILETEPWKATADTFVFVHGCAYPDG